MSSSARAGATVNVLMSTRYPAFGSRVAIAFLSGSGRRAELTVNATEHRSSQGSFLRISRRRHGMRDDQSAFNQRAAASAVSSGFVLNAIAALGAALWTALITLSNSSRLFGGSLRPPPITTQS
jgi:predicted ABC-type transport system involved in lysophospholipase L1 biosynthesis ATPase subunit